MFMENENFYENLVALLKMFKDRPNHLAKYLLDNSAVNKFFLKKISQHDNLKNILENEEKLETPIYFTDINKMNDYYNTFTEDIKKLNKGKSSDEIELEINENLNKLISDEKYEDAARLRDYMHRHKIKRNK